MDIFQIEDSERQHTGIYMGWDNQVFYFMFNFTYHSIFMKKATSIKKLKDIHMQQVDYSELDGKDFILIETIEES